MPSESFINDTRLSKCHECLTVLLEKSKNVKTVLIINNVRVYVTKRYISVRLEIHELGETLGIPRTPHRIKGRDIFFYV